MCRTINLQEHHAETNMQDLTAAHSKHTHSQAAGCGLNPPGLGGG